MVLSQNKELEKKIRELIDSVTCSKYVSPLEVEEDNGMYVLRLSLNCKDAAPISFIYNGDEEGFFEFLRKEFKRRRLQEVMYSKQYIENSEVEFNYPVIEL